MTTSVAADPAKDILLSQPIDIPIFHEVALRLLQMMDDHTYKIEEVIKLVNEDTALATEMLRHANTTYNSGKAPITTIKSALVRLGSQQVVNLAFTASMANSASDHPVIMACLKKLWRHSHAVAISSSWLAAQVSHDKKIVDINVDEVYLAGLLHDIGKLYLLQSFDRLITAGLLYPEQIIINKLVNKFNTEQGVKVMRHFKLPEIYTNSVERHLAVDWKCGSNDYLVAAVRLSCKLHHYIEQQIDLKEGGKAYKQIKDELAFLDIRDVTYVGNMIAVISE